MVSRWCSRYGAERPSRRLRSSLDRCREIESSLPSPRWERLRHLMALVRDLIQRASSRAIQEFCVRRMPPVRLLEKSAAPAPISPHFRYIRANTICKEHTFGPIVNFSVFHRPGSRSNVDPCLLKWDGRRVMRKPSGQDWESDRSALSFLQGCRRCAARSVSK